MATTCLGTTILAGAAAGARPPSTVCLVGTTFGAVGAKLAAAVSFAVGTATATCLTDLPEVRASLGTAVTAFWTLTFS